MARRGYQGESPKDRATNMMDKFIQRSNRKIAREGVKPLRRKDPDVPLHLWPLKDQIEYWDNLTAEDWFKKKYTYDTWYNEIMKKSNMYHMTFIDCISPHKKRLQQLFESCIEPKDALFKLRKEGILH